jgi:catechol 2,3-dioxygenase-like lactoylglutathione lyase family enzyme
MFSHVHIGIVEFSRSFDFYKAVLCELELELRHYEPEQSWAAWAAPGNDRPLFFIGLPFDRAPQAPGNGHMTAFLAFTREAVDRCHAKAIASGGRCEGPPGMRPNYHAHYYGAYFRDPDGNKLCVCCHAPAAPKP